MNDFCKYNKMIHCSNCTQCNGCGWNPSVTLARKKKLRRELNGLNLRVIKTSNPKHVLPEHVDTKDPKLRRRYVEIVRMQAEGKTDEEMAEACNISVSVIKKNRQLLQLPINN